MNIFKKYIYQILIIFLLGLLIFGYSLNKKSSASKKNEISIFTQQLKARNTQISKIQKNLFKDGVDINDLINKNEINFQRIFELEGVHCFFTSVFEESTVEAKLNSCFLYFSQNTKCFALFSFHN